MDDATRGSRGGWCRRALVVMAAGLVWPVLGCSPGSSTPTAPLVVVAAADGVDVAPGDGRCDGPDGCTLRAALQEANARPGTDRITFGVAGTGVVRITPASPLPTVVGTVVIDGSTQPGARRTTVTAPAPPDGVIRVELVGPGTRGSSALVLGPGSAGSEVRGLSIGGFDDALVMADDRVVVAGNHVGVDAGGLVPVPNLGCGVSQGLDDVDDVRVGGTAPADRNVISANEECGISPNTGSDRWVVQGNYLGTDVTGARALPNRRGGALSLDNSDDHVIGGAQAGAANLISGNETFGIAPHGSHGSLILGNLIGTDHTGTAPLPNLVGIGLGEDTSAVIGGAGPGQGNLVAGNTWLDVSLGGDHSVVAGNRIGVLADGTPAGGAVAGVAVGLAATGNLIGGEAPGEGNRIAGQDTGVLVLAFGGLAPSDNTVVGNDLHDHRVAAIDLAWDTDGDLVPDHLVGPDPAGAGPDPAGPNGQQPAPVLRSAVVTSDGLLVDLAVPAGPPGRDLVLHLYGTDRPDPSGRGGGRVLLGSVVAVPGVDLEWAVPWAPGVDPGSVTAVSATATAATGTAPGGRGATGEFSAAVAPGGGRTVLRR